MNENKLLLEEFKKIFRKPSVIKQAESVIFDLSRSHKAHNSLSATQSPLHIVNFNIQINFTDIASHPRSFIIRFKIPRLLIKIHSF